VFALQTELLTVKPRVTLTYTWDAPMRRGVLALEVAEGVLVFSELVAPLPMSMRDGLRLMSDQRHCAVNSNAVFVVVADEILPIGVLPTLGGDTMVSTPTGDVAVQHLKAGQMITTASGELAQVRWCGSAMLPARGRFKPLTLRAPYHGLKHDMIMAADQRLRLPGTEVEYLFGTDVVVLRAGHLIDEVAVRMKIAGLTVEGLDVTGVQLDPSLRKYSALAALPLEPAPPRPHAQVPVLQSYEALTLRKLLVA
jgi:hypothetical protein